MCIRDSFETHDPTQLNRQGNDIGTQYRSVILFSNETQRKLAEDILNEYQSLLFEAGYGKVVTLIEPLDNFYLAENYHQDYLKKNPNGYCPDLSTGVVFNEKEKDILDNQDQAHYYLSEDIKNGSTHWCLKHTQMEKIEIKNPSVSSK